ncbi:MAG: DUF2332 family protein [Chloroflexi bacterium]|nr:DUF2332 family protein [Chloroflexota bacterium]
MAQQRDLFRLYAEPPGDPGPVLRLTAFRRGVSTEVKLANLHPHGAWIEWLA